jgi:hypothetical protein
MLGQWTSRRLYAYNTATEQFAAACAPIPGYQPVVRALRVTGTDGACLVNAYCPKRQYMTKTYSALATPWTALIVELDKPATTDTGYVGGHLLSTSDFVLIPTSTGLQIRAISAVAATATNMYETLTIAAATTNLPEHTPVYIVRAADVVTIDVDSATITERDIVAGDPSMPLVLSAVAATSTKLTSGGACIEYVPHLR